MFTLCKQRAVPGFSHLQDAILCLVTGIGRRTPLFALPLRPTVRCQRKLPAGRIPKITDDIIHRDSVGAGEGLPLAVFQAGQAARRDAGVRPLIAGKPHRPVRVRVNFPHIGIRQPGQRTPGIIF